MAATEQQPVCCIFSQLDDCMAYTGGHVANESILFPDKQHDVSYHGSATVCVPTTMPGDLQRQISIFNGRDTSSSGHGEALFRRIHPAEIKQGSVPDCWLMAIIAAMSRFPNAVRKIFLQQFRAQNGDYNIQLYDATF